MLKRSGFVLLVVLLSGCSQKESFPWLGQWQQTTVGGAPLTVEFGTDSVTFTDVFNTQTLTGVRYLRAYDEDNHDWLMLIDGKKNVARIHEVEPGVLQVFEGGTQTIAMHLKRIEQ